MQAARSRNSRRPCDVRSHVSTANDSAEVQRSSHSGIYEREISNTNFPRLSESEAEFHGRTFLGKRVLCQYGWIRRKTDSGLHSESGARREATRADAIVRNLTIAASRGFHQTTRSAGGI